MIQPPVYPDQVKHFLSEDDAEKLFGKVNEIFHKTGCPALPLFLLPPALAVLYMFYIEDLLTQLVRLCYLQLYGDYKA